jgi:hypothetical protein
VSRKPETLFEEKVRDDLALLKGGWFFKLMAGSIRGLPDRVGCLKGRFIALELKVGPNRADKLQGWTLGKLKAAGAYTAVVTPENWGKIYAELQSF